VYFERWQRRVGDGRGEKYLAMVRREMSPHNRTDDRPIDNGRVDGRCSCFDRYRTRRSVFVVMGNFFAQAVDRDVNSLPSYSGATGAGCAALVDHALSMGDLDQVRYDVVSMLDMVGLVGHIKPSEGADDMHWMIDISTHPWLENKPLLGAWSKLSLSYEGDGLRGMEWDGQSWDIIENSFTMDELRHLLGLSRGTVEVIREASKFSDGCRLDSKL